MPNTTPELHVYVNQVPRWTHVFTQPAFKPQKQIDPWDAQIKTSCFCYMTEDQICLPTAIISTAVTNFKFLSLIGSVPLRL
jgi:hypothetical protein